MRHIDLHSFLSLFILLSAAYARTACAQGVGIGTGTPAASAQLELNSTSKGFLAPRMTGAQMIAISSPATGLSIYNTDSGTYCIYTGSAWIKMITSANGPWTVSGNAIYNANSGNVGIGTASPTALLHVSDGSLLVNGSFGFGGNITASGQGSRMFFDVNKSAFRAGEVINDRWDNVNVGQNSFAAGFETLCSGNYSSGLGASNVSSGAVASCIGANNTASGQFSTAIGISNTASGASSTALGRGNTAASFGEMCLGLYGTTYTPNNTTSFDASDRLLNIGKGTSTSARSDALTVLKRGYVGIGTSGPASTLEVSGSLGLKVLTGQAAGTNNPDAGAAIWIYSSGTGTITLPAAGACANRSYAIINSTGAVRSISSYKDLTGTAQTSIGNGISLWLISDGSSWYQVK